METGQSDPAADLGQAIERVEAAKRADKQALWAGTTGAGLAMVILAGAAMATAWWAIIVVAVAFALPYRLAKIILSRTQALKHSPRTGDLQPKTASAGPEPEQSAAPSAPRPRSALVTRLEFAPTVHAHEVLTANLQVSETLRGGRPGVDFRDLPLGVFLVTEKGLAFLPAARGKLEEMIGEVPATVVSHLSGELFEPLELVERIHGVIELTKEPPTIAQWMHKALKQKHQFVIAWTDLVGVMLGREHTILSRDTGAGEREDFIILDASPSWPEVLMQRRIMIDLKEAVYAKLLRPKFAECFDNLRQTRPGDTADDGLKIEAARGAMAWFSESISTLEPEIRRAMAPAIHGYSYLPAVVEKQPWLFEKVTE